jgi:pyrrolysine biosynthesis protein PylD
VVTRLTEGDVRDLIERLPAFEADLRGVCGLDLRSLALHACCLEGKDSPLERARVAAVPISTGQGVIPCFSECVRVILAHLGCDAFVTDNADVRGLQEAIDRNADVVFVADDHRFVAINVGWSACADNDPCTANGYVAALHAACGGLHGRDVLVLGLGPVGRAAAQRLTQLGARVLAVEPDPVRADLGVLYCGAEIVALEEGLRLVDLVFDATPAPGLVASEWVTPRSVAAVPAVPSSFTASAQALLGPRHIHEPLAVGVAVMAVEALTGTPSPRPQREPDHRQSAAHQDPLLHAAERARL